jgi:hypothetical protein
MSKKKVPLTLSIRLISEDPVAIGYIIELLDVLPGLTPLKSDTTPKRGKDGKGWIIYHEVMISDEVGIQDALDDFTNRGL